MLEAHLYLYVVNSHNLVEVEGLCFLIGKQQWELSMTKLFHVEAVSEFKCFVLFYLIFSWSVVQNASFFTNSYTIFTLCAL